MFDDRPGQQTPSDPVSEWAVPGVDRPRVPGVPAGQAMLLAEAFAAVAELDLTRLAARDLVATTELLLKTSQQLQLVALQALAQVHLSQASVDEGLGTTSTWVSGLSVGADRTTVQVACRLADWPQVAQAVRDGRIGTGAAKALQTTLTRLRPFLDRQGGVIDGQPGEEVVEAVLLRGIPMLAGPHLSESGRTMLLERLGAIHAQLGADQRERVEAGVVELAASVPAGRLLREALEILLDAVLPLAHEARVRRGERQRRLQFRRKSDGSGYTFVGDLSLRCGEKLAAVLQAELARDPQAPVDTELAAALRQQGFDPHDPDLPEHPDLPAEARLPRVSPEVRHDALEAALDRYLAADLAGSRDKQPVRVTVTVTLESLTGEPGALPAVSGSGARIPHSLVTAWACDSAISRQVLDLHGTVIAASHTQRTLTATERNALHTRTGGWCQARGCTRHAGDLGARMHPHHATAWARSHTTSLSDTVLLCERDHSRIHHGRTLTMKDGRRLSASGWVE